MSTFRSQGTPIAGDPYPTANEISDAVDAAAASATSASNSATAASASETAAELAETNAETAETNAETAVTNAETAQTAAETAQTAAELAETNAETAETNAETAETGAEAAQAKAEAAAANLGGKNFLCNTSFIVNQKGESGYTGMSAGAYVHDRWRVEQSTGTGVVTVITETDVTPGQDTGGIAPHTAFRLDVTTADAVVDASDLFLLGTGIIDYDAIHLYDKNIVLSFRVKSNLTGTYCIALQDASASYSYVDEFTIDSANTWEKKEIDIEFDTTVGGTWPTTPTGVAGIRVKITAMAGGNHQGTVGWNAGSVLGTSSIANILSSTSNDFSVTSLKLEVGTDATAYIAPAFILEKQNSLAYYQQSYEYGVAPGTVTNTGAMLIRVPAASAVYPAMSWVSPLRASPTATFYSEATGTANRIRNVTTAADLTVSTVGVSQGGLQQINTTVLPSDQDVVRWHSTVIAEII